MLKLHIQFAKLKESLKTAYSWKRLACQSGTGWLTAKGGAMGNKIKWDLWSSGIDYLEEGGEFMAQGKTEQLILQGTR